MTKVFIVNMINSRYNDEITTSHKRLKKYLHKQGWLTLDNKLNDKFGVFVRDNYL